MTPGPQALAFCLYGSACRCLYDACGLCGGPEPPFPFTRHYACIQRARQLGARWVWTSGEWEAWP